MDIKLLIESLSPLERKVIPFLKEENIGKIIENSELDRVSVLRALDFLNSKKAIVLKISKKKIVDLGINGIFYKKKRITREAIALYFRKRSCKDRISPKRV